MYYIVYGFFYTLSLIPWRIFYFISDCIYALLYYVFGYRKKVVMANLLIAFPDKTEKERVKIAKEFYHNFIDTFIEMIKLFSISEKEFDKRMVGNYSVLHELYETGQNVQLNGGHFFNWEFVNWGIAKNSPYRFLGIYAPMSNKVVDRIMLKIRSRFNTVLINAYTFKTSFHQVAKGRFMLALAADQNPPSPEKSYWVNFFGRLTAFFPGPEKGAIKNKTAVVFVHYFKIKRGYYRVEFTPFTSQPENYDHGILTKEYVKFLERCIQKEPANYLWSHRRWKHQYREEFSKNLVE
jgi:KDO2-lipid IV(A) lauroyltransferase